MVRRVLHREEPYTMAIVLSQVLNGRKDWDVRIVATDISEKALRSAKDAMYGEYSLRAVPRRSRGISSSCRGPRTGSETRLGPL